jgi:dihydroorotate dehydrogenase (fumarate)
MTSRTGVDLSTSYLGLALRCPLVASPSPLTGTVDGARALADAGVGAVVLPSLYEEDVTRRSLADLAVTEPFADAHGEAEGYLPRPRAERDATSTRYLRLLERTAAALDVPVLASLNGSTLGGWTAFARRMQDAGAAALELNVSLMPAPDTSGREVEDRHVEVLQAVRDAVTLPVAVKVGPWFSSPGELALRLDAAGADGLVLFNRFVHPDVDAEALAVVPGGALSTPAEGRLVRAWVAVLSRRVQGSLAATGGVEGPRDVAAHLLAGADVVMSTSALLRHGPAHAAVLLDGLRNWLRRKGLSSVDEARGLLAVPPGAGGEARERAAYVAALDALRRSWTGAAPAP